VIAFYDYVFFIYLKQTNIVEYTIGEQQHIQLIFFGVGDVSSYCLYMNGSISTGIRFHNFVVENNILFLFCV